MKKSALFLVYISIFIFLIYGCSVQQIVFERTAIIDAMSPRPSSYAADFKQSPWFDSNTDWMGLLLPPVDERLPWEPVVWDEVEDAQIGNYINYFSGDRFGVLAHLYEPLFTMKKDDMSHINGNIFKSYEVSEDYKEYTFRLREGLRWSDGVPLTIEDVRFSLQDIWRNEALLKAVYSDNRQISMLMGKEDKTADTYADQRGIPKFTEIDDYTFKLNYRQPMPNLPMLMATGSYTSLLYPAHFFKAAHPDYRTTVGLTAVQQYALQEAIAELDKQPDSWSWVYEWQNFSIMPTLNAWVPAYVKDDQSRTTTYVRNPYYFKVDAAGQQLPYFDTIDIQAKDMETDYGYWQPVIDKCEQVTKSAEYAQSHHLSLHEDILLPCTWGGAAFMYANTDPVWHELIRMLPFRQALCWAIDPTVLLRDAAGGYGHVPPTQYTGWQYQPDRAIQALEEMGMERNALGKWMWKDEVVTIILAQDSFDQSLKTFAQSYKEMWEAFGFSVELVVQSNTAYSGILESGSQYAWDVAYIAADMKVPLEDVMKTTTGMEYWLNFADFSGAYWEYTNGERGIESCPEILEFFKIVHHIDELELPFQHAVAYERALQYASDQALFLPGIWDIPTPVAVAADIKNIPKKGYLRNFCDTMEGWYR